MSTAAKPTTSSGNSAKRDAQMAEEAAFQERKRNIVHEFLVLSGKGGVDRFMQRLTRGKGRDE